jgi:hypothetical protein
MTMRHPGLCKLWIPGYGYAERADAASAVDA